MFQMIWEVLSNSSVWGLMIVLFILSWAMEYTISKMALLCRSVYIVWVPWGILCLTTFAYFVGILEYKQVIALGFLYLAAYPGLWWQNYKFTRDLEAILRRKHVTKETSEQAIWPEEVRWIWVIKRKYRKLVTRNKLDDQVVDWILDYRGRNGYSQRHGIPLPSEPRDN